MRVIDRPAALIAGLTRVNKEHGVLVAGALFVDIKTKRADIESLQFHDRFSKKIEGSMRQVEAVKGTRLRIFTAVPNWALPVHPIEDLK